MNRRNAVKTVLAGVAVAVAFSSYEWWRLSGKPDLKYLTAKKPLIEALAETIIPRTETPGATDAGVASFIIHAVFSIINYKEAKSFIKGLQELEERCLNKHHKKYEQCNQAQQSEVLLHFQHQRLSSSNTFFEKVDNKIRGRSFFDVLKELTVIGYCTSEAGATQGLAYEYIPGVYRGCVPLQPGQKGWATK